MESLTVMTNQTRRTAVSSCFFPLVTHESCGGVVLYTYTHIHIYVNVHIYPDVCWKTG